MSGRRRRWWYRLSLRARLMIIGVVGVAVAITGAGIALDAILTAGIVKNLDAEAAAAADQVVTLVNTGDLPDPLPVAGALVIQVVDSQGRVLAGSAGADRLTPLIPADRLASSTGGAAITAPGSLAGVPGTLRVVVRVAGPASQPRWVLSAVSLTDVQRSTQALRSALLIADPVLLSVLGVIAWLVIGQALRPVEALRAAAERVSGTGTDEILPVPPADDEIHALATTLNDMLARLAVARERQRAFVADAAHELRSPLASLRTQLEIAARHGPTPDLVDDTLLDVDRLTRIVSDLLLLARSDTGELPSRPSAIDAGTVVAEGIEAVPARVPVARRLPDHPVPAVLDSDHLRRVVVNLVENAQRYATSRVRVHLEDGPETLVLDVDDDGPGIPVSDRDRVFERFTRLDPSRTAHGGGSGLGLPIVRHLLAAMGGTVAVADPPDGSGSRLRCTIPRRSTYGTASETDPGDDIAGGETSSGPAGGAAAVPDGPVDVPAGAALPPSRRRAQGRR
jgi:signal transduction histidine kinase